MKESDSYYCPFRLSNSGIPRESCYCLKEKCAWWDEVNKKCVVFSLYEKMKTNK
jgi:hypothetical protein